MQNKPDGWPAESSVEIIPEVYLKTDGAWPPPTDGVPAGTALLGSWKIDRSLTGSPLPGQVRGAVGFSIATGAASFAQPGDQPITPWSISRQHRLTVGGKCEVVASHLGPVAGLALGSFVIAPGSGNSIDNAVHVDLEEDSIRLKRQFRLDWTFNQDHAFYSSQIKAGNDVYELDASWVVDQVARSGGYFQTPPPPADCLISLPLVGGTMADRGTTTEAGIRNWSEVDDLVGLGPDSYVTAIGEQPPADTIWVGCQVAGTGGRVFLNNSMILDIHSNRLDLRSPSAVYASLPFSAPTRTPAVLVGVSRLAGRQVRAEVIVQGEPAGSVTATFPAEDWAVWSRSVSVDTRTSLGGGNSRDRFIRSVRVTSSNPEGLATWEPTARIHLSGSPLHGVFDQFDTDAWSVVQNIASATMGAVWISEDGVFTYRSRNRLRGMAGVLGEIEAAERLEDLPWQIDPGDVADRVELTYVPASAEYSPEGSLTLWEATEKIKINSGKSVDVFADIEGTTSRLADFKPIWDDTVPEGRWSRWAASSNINGGGERPRSNTITVEPIFITPSRIRLRVTNTSDETVWLVDGNGNPCLILRAFLHVAPDEPVTIALGAAPEEAISPLHIDAGSWIQDSAAAQSMLSWASGQTSHAQATVARVRVKPDLGYQLGDVHLLTDQWTRLRAKVLVTGVSLAGDHTGYTQHLDLALLDLTWEDFDRWLQSNQINTFSALDDFMSSRSIDTFELFDLWGQDFGGTL